MAERIARQRARLEAAEPAVFAHYGIEATSAPLALKDPPSMTRVVRCGQGPPVVLLHGSSMTATVWAPLLPHLEGRSLYLVDLPGCGMSDRFDYSGVDIAAHQSAFVGSVLDSLGLRRAALVGSSLGGMFALRYALEQPARVSALALVSAPALALPGAHVPFPMSMASSRRLGRLMNAMTPPPSPRMMRRLLAMIGGKASVRDIPEAMFDALGAAMALAGPTNASMGPEMFRRGTPHAHIPVTDDELAGCQVPVQFIWGQNDKVQPPQAAKRAAELLPDARVETLPGGHGIWFDVPDRCGELLTEFLRDTEQEATS